ncbi:Putative transposase (identified by ISEscan HMM) [Escherichia coli]|nr:Putative transposase (identified by ISEscan HMM) [Escherichia coli]
MIPLPSGTKIWLVAGITDMRNGFNGLAAKVQTTLKDDPMSGHVFIFRGRNGSQVKLLWSTGDGLCLLTKRLERGRFARRQPGMAKCSSHRHSWRCCWKVSTGGSLKTAYVPDYVVSLFIRSTLNEP